MSLPNIDAETQQVDEEQDQDQENDLCGLCGKMSCPTGCKGPFDECLACSRQYCKNPTCMYIALRRVISVR